MLQQARDEAHRTAVGYNRKRRTMRTVTSELLKIPGVGPKRKQALLRKFGSLKAIQEADAEALAAVPGMTRAIAEQIKAAL